MDRRIALVAGMIGTGIVVSMAGCSKAPPPLPPPAPKPEAATQTVTAVVEPAKTEDAPPADPTKLRPPAPDAQFAVPTGKQNMPRGFAANKPRKEPAKPVQKAPPVPAVPAPTLEEQFAHMNPDGNGLATESGIVAFKLWQNPKMPETQAKNQAKAMYAKIMERMPGDKSQGFNFEAYKNFKEGGKKK